MACDCNYVMVSVAILLFLGVASQTLSFALPGWVQFEPAEDSKNGTQVIFEKEITYSSGLWTTCKGGLSNCNEWLDDSFDNAKKVGSCAGDSIISVVPGQDQKPCRDYTNIEMTMWVTQALGMLFMAIALVLALMSSMAACCCGCCGDCCTAFCKVLILLVCMLASMAITVGLVLFGVTFAEQEYQGVIVKDGFQVVLKKYTLFYCFALSALAAVLGLLAAIITAFSRNDDGKV